MEGPNAGDTNDDGELWFSEDDSAEINASHDRFNFPWSVTTDFTCRVEATPESAQDLAALLDKARVSRDEVAAVYLVGPHLWGYATAASGYKLLMITNEDLKCAEKLNDRRQSKIRGDSKDTQPGHRDQRSFFLESFVKKGSKPMPRPVKVIVESIAGFEKRLLQHRELMIPWLPKDNVWLETAEMAAKRQEFKLDRAQLLKVVSSHYAIASKRFEKFCRKEDWSNARRVVLKIFRVFLLSLQVSKRGSIVNYTCQPELGRLGDAFNGPEIMSLSDTRESRINGIDSLEAISGRFGDSCCIKSLWKNLVEPLMGKVQAACTSQLQVYKQAQDHSQTIYKAIAIEDGQRLFRQLPPLEVVSQLQHLVDIYETIQASCVVKCAGLQTKLLEINSALTTVRQLIADRAKPRELTDSIVNTVCLPIGAQCMLEFKLEESLELLQTSENIARATLKSTEGDLAYVREQLSVTQMNMVHALDYLREVQQMSLLGSPHRRASCVVDFLINIDDVKKHHNEKSIPDYYLDLVDYLGEERSDAAAFPVWMNKATESKLCFSAHTSIFYKHMGSATFFEKNRDFENSKFRRNQAVSAMTAPYTKKDGLARILREYRGEVGGTHPADAGSSIADDATLLHTVKLEIRFEPGPIGITRRGRRIVDVSVDSQAAHQNVKPGWLLDSVDGEPYTEALLKGKKDGEVSYTIGFEESCTRVSAVSADNIAPRSFTVGVGIEADTAYDDITSFEEEYLRGLAIAVCRRTLVAIQAVENDFSHGQAIAVAVNSPFCLDVACAAADILRYCSSQVQDRIYRLRGAHDFPERPSAEKARYDSALKILLHNLYATPLKQFDDVNGWEHESPYASLKEQDLESVLQNAATWDPQMKTLYGVENLWILKPKGLGRGKGIFVAECIRDITDTPGLDHLFSSFDFHASRNSLESGTKLNVSTVGEEPAQSSSNATAGQQLILDGNEVEAASTVNAEVGSTRFGGYGLTKTETGWVAQKYIERPLLFAGRKKFDIRFMALVSFVGNDQLEAATSALGSGDLNLPWGQTISGGAHAGGRLTFYSFEDSVMKICAADYHGDDEVDGELRHLTNHAVQEHHPLYNPEEGVQDSAAACAFGSLGSHIPPGVVFAKKNEDDLGSGPERIYYDILLPQMRALAYRVFRATPWEKDWARDEGFYPTDVRFQLFGFDMMVDEDYRVWVIEVNQQPGLSAEGVPAMTRIMRRLLRGMFGILLDVERYDLICSSSVGSTLASANTSSRGLGWPASADGWAPLECI